MGFIRSKKLVSLLFTLIVFGINTVIPSQINGFPQDGLNFNLYNLIDNDYAEVVFNLRYESPVFRTRPFVLEFQRNMDFFLGVPFQLSFNIINFFFLYVFFLLVCSVLDKERDRLDEMMGQLFFFLSLPIIFCFFGSICTYDDIVQYTFLLFFLRYLFRGYVLLSSLFFTLAIIARETSLVYYFVIVFYYLLDYKKNIRVTTVFLWLLPITVYLLFLDVYLPKDLIVEGKEFLIEKRFYAWMSNFESWKIARESITLTCFMVLPYLYLLHHKHIRVEDYKVKKWCEVLFMFVCINAIIVLFTGLVREVRLFFIPLLIVIPFVQNDIKQLMLDTFKRNNLNTLIVVQALVVSVSLSFLFFTPVTHGTGIVLKIYLFFSLFVFFMILLSKRKMVLSKKELITKTNHKII